MKINISRKIMESVAKTTSTPVRRRRRVVESLLKPYTEAEYRRSPGSDRIEGEESPKFYSVDSIEGSTAGATLFFGWVNGFLDLQLWYNDDSDFMGDFSLDENPSYSYGLSRANQIAKRMSQGASIDELRDEFSLNYL